MGGLGDVEECFWGSGGGKYVVDESNGRDACSAGVA